MKNMAKVTGLTKVTFNREANKWMSPDLERRLTKQAFCKAVSFWGEHTLAKKITVDFDSYYENLLVAKDSHLFQKGGIEVKDHINLFVILKILDVSFYIESGVFTGSSLHAALTALEPQDVYGIDPNLKNLNGLVKDMITNRIETVNDFEKLNFTQFANNKIVYFDDHIDTADRMSSALNKGFNYAIFDDSTGFEGIGQRQYPALPTLGMLESLSVLQAGDEFAWSVPVSGFRNRLKRIFAGDIYQKYMRMHVTIDQSMIDKMHQMHKAIEWVMKFPDLSEYLFSNHVGRLNNTTKYLVKLKNDK